MNISDVPDDWDNSPLESTVRYMKETGFHEWGFVIYRCTYGDDDLWNQYVAALKQDVHENLAYCGRDRLLEQYAKWTIVEDQALDRASKELVRERFVNWRDESSIARNPPPLPLPTDASSRLPRFTYCLYVDQNCLETLKAHAEAKIARKQPGLGPKPPPLVAVLIDGDHQQSSTSHPRHQGATRNYLGWGYYDV